MLPFREETEVREKGICRGRGLTCAVTECFQETWEIGLGGLQGRDLGGRSCGDRETSFSLYWVSQKVC